jgi:hypothetical protein
VLQSVEYSPLQDLPGHRRAHPLRVGFAVTVVRCLRDRRVKGGADVELVLAAALELAERLALAEAEEQQVVLQRQSITS